MKKESRPLLMPIRSVAFVMGLLLFFAAGCGVKGPPLPPISAIPTTPEEKSLGRKATPVEPLPSPNPSAAGEAQ